MGLDSLPTRTTGSLGPTKVDEAPAPDLVHHVTAAEWNEAADRIAEIAAVLGLGDGSTNGSAFAALMRAVSKPGAGFGRWAFSDDFDCLRNGTDQPWSTSVTGSGSISGIIDAGSPPAISDGFGWLGLAAGPGAGTALLIHRTELLRVSTHAPLELRARVQLPSDLATGIVKVGFYGSGGASSLLLESTTAGEWRVTTTSDFGAGADAVVITNLAPVGGTPADVHLILSADQSVAVYIDGELAELDAVPVAASVPQAEDLLAWEVFLSATGSVEAFVDYVAVSGVRP